MTAPRTGNEVVKLTETVEALAARVAELEKVIVDGSIVTKQVRADEILTHDLTVEHPDHAGRTGPHARLTARVPEGVELILASHGNESDGTAVALNVGTVDNDPAAGINLIRHGNTLASFDVIEGGNARTGTHVAMRMGCPEDNGVGFLEWLDVHGIAALSAEAPNSDAGAVRDLVAAVADLTARLRRDADDEGRLRRLVTEEVTRILGSGEAIIRADEVHAGLMLVSRSDTGPSVTLEVVGDKVASIEVSNRTNLASMRVGTGAANVKVHTGDPATEGITAFLEATADTTESHYAGLFLNRLGNAVATFVADEDADEVVSLSLSDGSAQPSTSLTCSEVRTPKLVVVGWDADGRLHGEAVKPGGVQPSTGLAERVERALALEERLTGLERWRTAMATKVVTKELEARQVAVVAPDGTMRIFMHAGDDFGTVSVMAKDRDEAPRVGLYATLEGVRPDGTEFPDAYLVARVGDEDVAWLGYSGHPRPDGPEPSGELTLARPDGHVVAMLPSGAEAGQPPNAKAPS